MSILVIVESPYSGNIEENVDYAREAVKHSLSLNESPIASHLLYTQPGILDDNLVEERAKGIKSGQDWIRVVDKMAVYADGGISPGMLSSIEIAKYYRVPIEFRYIKRKSMT